MKRFFKIFTTFSLVNVAVIPAITVTSCSKTLIIEGDAVIEVYAGNETKKDYIVTNDNDVTFSIKSLETGKQLPWIFFKDNKLNIKNAPSNRKGERKFRITAVSNTDPSATGTLDIVVNILTVENDISTIITNTTKPADENIWLQDDIMEDLKMMNPDVEEEFWSNVELFNIEANSFFIISKTAEYTGALIIENTQVYNLRVETTNEDYYVFDINDLCTITNDYILINSKHVARTSIIKVEIDSKTLTEIPSYFLYKCSNLFYLDFSKCTNLLSIADNFLFQSGNSLAQVDFPSSLKTINNQFCLYSDENVVWDFSKTQLETIGSSFLQHNANLNKQVILPSTVKTIGSDFMIACTNFNQDLALPPSLTSIGERFMFDAKNYTSSIDFGDLTESIFAGADDKTKILSTSDKNAACYTIGIKVTGTNIDSIIQILPNLEEVGLYRNLIK